MKEEKHPYICRHKRPQTLPNSECLNFRNDPKRTHFFVNYDQEQTIPVAFTHLTAPLSYTQQRAVTRSANLPFTITTRTDNNHPVDIYTTMPK